MHINKNNPYQNCKSKSDLSCMLSETSISHVDVMNVLDILSHTALIDSRLCSDFSTATSVYFGVESSKLGQAVSGKWGGHGGEVNGTGDWGAMIVATSEV